MNLKKYYVLSAKKYNNGIFTPCYFKALNKKKAQRILIDNIFDKNKSNITAIKMVILN